MASVTFSVRDHRRDRGDRGVGAHLQVLQAAHDAQVRRPSAAASPAFGGDEDGSGVANQRQRRHGCHG